MNNVIDANVAVHTALADTYNTDEPHFRPENQRKVAGRIEALRSRTGGDRLLDLGCGTGFIINLAKAHFSRIDGVDITPAMLAKVDTSGYDIHLHEGRVENLPFEADTFDAATAYSFLDHLENPAEMVREAARVLKPGGELYIDLVPNRHYWQTLSASDLHGAFNMSEFAMREHRMVTQNDKRVEEEYGIPAETFRAAEPAKEGQGVDPLAFQALAIANGFAECEVHFDWFLGNAKVLHQQSEDDARVIDAYLHECLPYSMPLFKYVWFVLRKAGA